jgi:hypothetical protein
MAQTKTKPKSRPKAKPKAKSRTTSKAKPKSSSNAKSKVKNKGTAKSKSGRNSSAKANGSSPVSKAGGSLEIVKGPATARGAALLAVAGGVAAASASRSRGKSGLTRGVSGKKVMKTLKKVDLPDADDAIDWIEKKAKGLGDAGYKVAEASSQARSAKKAVSGK